MLMVDYMSLLHSLQVTGEYMSLRIAYKLRVST